MTAYTVTTYYHDGDTWVDGERSTEAAALELAQNVAEEANPEIVAMVSVLKDRREIRRITQIGEL